MRNLTWYKIKAEFSFLSLSSKMRSHYVSTINSVVKEVSNSANLNHEKIFFHLTDLKLNEIPKINSPINTEIILIYDEVKTTLWHKSLLKYFESRKNRRNIIPIKITTPEKRNFQHLCKEIKIDKQIVCLNFYSPINFSKYYTNLRTFIKSEDFLRLFTKRLKRLFDIDIPDFNIDNIEVLPYFWDYVQYKHYSKSQPGHIKYINGCIGNILIRGDVYKIKDLLILCSELHCGSKISYSFGYYKIESPDFLDKELTDYNSIKSLSKNTRLKKSEIFDVITKIQQKDYRFESIDKETLKVSNKKDRFLIEAIEKKFIKIANSVIKSLFKGNLIKITNETYYNYFEINAIKGFCFYCYIKDVDFMPQINFKNFFQIFNKYFTSENELFLDILQKYVHYPVNNEYSKHLLPVSDLAYKISELFFVDKLIELKKEFNIARYNDGYFIFSRNYDELKNFFDLINVKIYSIYEKVKIEDIEINIIPPEEQQSEEGITVFITSPYTYLRKQDKTLIVQKNNSTIAQIPLINICDIVISNDSAITTPLINECLTNNIPISIAIKNNFTTIFPQNNKFYNLIFKHSHKYYTLAEENKLEISKKLLTTKIKNYISVIFFRKIKDFKELIRELSTSLKNIKKAESLDQLRGIEGYSASKVFEMYKKLILQKEFMFNKREPFGNDYFNVLLNSGYRLLRKDINVLLRVNGLNPYLGFLHSPDNNYESLVYDLMEIFRPVIDKIVLKLINLKIITPGDFNSNENFKKLNFDGMKKLFQFYQHTMFQKGYKNILQNQINILKEWVENKGEIEFTEIKGR